mgnify:CR=1 FL=1
MDYRQNQRVIATIGLADQGQDFTELDVLENGVILGYSTMFSDGRLSLIGIGALDGTKYWTLADLKKKMPNSKELKGAYVYFKETGTKDPLPWKADTLRYPVTGKKKVEKPDRFIKAKK